MAPRLAPRLAEEHAIDVELGGGAAGDRELGGDERLRGGEGHADGDASPRSVLKIVGVQDHYDHWKAAK